MLTKVSIGTQTAIIASPLTVKWSLEPVQPNLYVLSANYPQKPPFHRALFSANDDMIVVSGPEGRPFQNVTVDGSRTELPANVGKYPLIVIGSDLQVDVHTQGPLRKLLCRTSVDLRAIEAARNQDLAVDAAFGVYEDHVTGEDSLGWLARLAYRRLVQISGIRHSDTGEPATLLDMVVPGDIWELSTIMGTTRMVVLNVGKYQVGPDQPHETAALVRFPDDRKLWIAAPVFELATPYFER